MNKILLRIAGLISLLFVLLHLGMVKPIETALARLSPDIGAAVSTLNSQVAFALLVFGYLAIFRSHDLLTTRLGQIMALAIGLFWLLRAIDQAVFYGLSASGIPLIGLCLAVALLHLIPVLRERQSARFGAPVTTGQLTDLLSRSQEQIGRTPWTSYAVVAWCVLFGGLHLYWAVGGTAGFAEFSMPPNKVLALTRDPMYMAITWGVVVACVVGAIVALAPFQAWTRRVPSWALLAPLWIACGLFLVRGVGNPVQSALIVAGGMPFDPLPAAEVPAWNQWMLMDAIFYSPWFILGALAFGATAWRAHRPQQRPAFLAGAGQFEAEGDKT